MAERGDASGGLRVGRLYGEESDAVEGTGGKLWILSNRDDASEGSGVGRRYGEV